MHSSHALLDLSPSRSHAPLSVCACHCYSAGDIKALEHCTQLTDVSFYRCELVAGESSGGRFLSESQSCGPVRTLCWNIPDIKSFLLLVGTLPGIVIKLISEGNANFDGCDGPFYLPTDLSSIKDIKKIDLSSLRRRLQGRKFPYLRTSPLFQWNFPFFGVTDSALPTLFSTSLPRGLMLLSPFLLATATPQATLRRSRSARS